MTKKMFTLVMMLCAGCFAQSINLTRESHECFKQPAPSGRGRDT